ncbi:hypothetical protein BGZ98_003854, partial [Dissophora globulifera]
NFTENVKGMNSDISDASHAVFEEQFGYRYNIAQEESIELRRNIASASIGYELDKDTNAMRKKV